LLLLGQHHGQAQQSEDDRFLALAVDLLGLFGRQRRTQNVDIQCRGHTGILASSV
jgi:hypothetical protein